MKREPAGGTTRARNVLDPGTPTGRAQTSLRLRRAPGDPIHVRGRGAAMNHAAHDRASRGASMARAAAAAMLHGASHALRHGRVGPTDEDRPTAVRNPDQRWHRKERPGCPNGTQAEFWGGNTTTALAVAREVT